MFRLMFLVHKTYPLTQSIFFIVLFYAFYMIYISVYFHMFSHRNPWCPNTHSTHIYQILDETIGSIDEPTNQSHWNINILTHFLSHSICLDVGCCIILCVPRSRTICLANGVVSSTSEIDINNVNNNQSNEPQRKCRPCQVKSFPNTTEAGGINVELYPLVNVSRCQASQMV